jgi:hypothetical protein
VLDSTNTSPATGIVFWSSKRFVEYNSTETRWDSSIIKNLLAI